MGSGTHTSKSRSVERQTRASSFTHRKGLRSALPDPNDDRFDVFDEAVLRLLRVHE